MIYFAMTLLSFQDSHPAKWVHWFTIQLGRGHGPLAMPILCITVQIDILGYVSCKTSYNNCTRMLKVFTMDFKLYKYK